MAKQAPRGNCNRQENQKNRQSQNPLFVEPLACTFSKISHTLIHSD